MAQRIAADLSKYFSYLTFRLSRSNELCFQMVFVRKRLRGSTGLLFLTLVILLLTLLLHFTVHDAHIFEL